MPCDQLPPCLQWWPSYAMKIKGQLLPPLVPFKRCLKESAGTSLRSLMGAPDGYLKYQLTKLSSIDEIFQTQRPCSTSWRRWRHWEKGAEIDWSTQTCACQRNSEIHQVLSLSLGQGKYRDITCVCKADEGVITCTCCELKRVSLGEEARMQDTSCN